MEPLLRQPLLKCRRYLAAIAGESWTPVGACAAGKSTAISAKTNRLDPASFKVDRVRPLLNTLMPTHASSIDVKPFSVRLNFHGDLGFFLRSRTRSGSIERSLSEKTSVKDVIESCGIPHPEVDVILVCSCMRLCSMVTARVHKTPTSKQSK